MTLDHIISIITPVYDGGEEFLGETYESLAAQKMPPGWSWQWIVQEDGQTGRPLVNLPDDSRISTGTGRRGGASFARMTAFARAKGVLTRALDADDVLTPGALWRDIETLSTHPHLGWCVSGGLDLMPDGSLQPPPRTVDFQDGPLEPGAIFESFDEGEIRVICTSMTAYTALILAVGGWIALPASEDTSLLLACEAVADGWMIATPSMYYRKHPAQSIKKPAFHAPDEIAMRRASVTGRRNALAQSGWRFIPPDPLPPIQPERGTPDQARDERWGRGGSDTPRAQISPAEASTREGL